ncbi:MAG: FAD-dependent oxidoreductase, partial [Erysipelotrichaceae bacterium]|nr:FAD-dependent oxidoreductase [Erysipelotrichaceae bacterium]
TFKEELSGPAYAERYYELIRDIPEIRFVYDTAVVKIEDGNVLTLQSSEGYETLKAGAVILATGSRERSAGAIGLRGDRPQGVYTAGTAQQYLNKEGFLVGKRVFILGSGDIGLIMARRMTLEGATVVGVAELMPYSNGLARNIKQCLEDFDIPLYLSHTVKAIHGKKRLEAISLIAVDENRKEIPGSEEIIPVDTLLLSVGLIPENELIEDLGIEMDRRTRGAVVDSRYMTTKEGIFACGNALHVHDLVDYVSEEGRKCGKAAGEYLLGIRPEGEAIHSVLGNGVSYMVPQSFYKGSDREFMFRVTGIYKKAKIHIYGDGLDKRVNALSLVPSEMVKVKLKKEELDALQGDLHWEVEA